MHFWIDKRSSQLHNYGGRGRPGGGSGGFYSRTFGNRHHHPPPLLRQSSASSSSNVPPPQPRSNVPSSNSPHVLTFINYTPSANHLHTTNSVQNPIPTAAMLTSEHLSNPNIIRHSSDPLRLPHHPSSEIMRNVIPGYFNVQQNSSNSGQPEEHHSHLFFGSRSGNDLPGQYIQPSDENMNINAMRGVTMSQGRRQRSHGGNHAFSGRRRSSNSGFNQRRTTHRFSADPYNISQSQHSRNLNTMAQIWQEERSVQDHNPLSSGGFNTSTDFTSSPRAAIEVGPATIDPAWKRTKRIGLTLCFMAVILLSTVAAKFVIEGPLLIDKQPRGERTEATIYFFLTELVFVAFAMALFFTGVTCLRKRTNAYLLRQFNQYIMQTSPNGATHPNEFSSSSLPEGNMTINSNSQPRPFNPHFNPLENHLMNMHITVAESAAGLKPPPYHIALYLPVPDEGMEAEAEEPGKLKRNNSSSQQSSSWISSCLVDGDQTEAPKNYDEEDSEDEGEAPQRKRSRSDEIDRAETPPPPYSHV